MEKLKIKNKKTNEIIFCLANTMNLISKEENSGKIIKKKFLLKQFKPKGKNVILFNKI